MILALSSAKAPTDRLDKENPALGRPRENDATDVQIDAGRQYAVCGSIRVSPERNR